MSRFLSLFILLSLLAGCGKQKEKSDVSNNAVEITAADFFNSSGDILEQTVMITGTVVHVCRHGGQRLFIVGNDPEKQIKITAGEDIPEFDIGLEGSRIRITGVVKEIIIDDASLSEWEAEVHEGPDERGHSEEQDSCREYLSDCWIEAISFSALDAE